MQTYSEPSCVSNTSPCPNKQIQKSYFRNVIKIIRFLFNHEKLQLIKWCKIAWVRCYLNSDHKNTTSQPLPLQLLPEMPSPKSCSYGMEEPRLPGAEWGEVEGLPWQGENWQKLPPCAAVDPFHNIQPLDFHFVLLLRRLTCLPQS